MKINEYNEMMSYLLRPATKSPQKGSSKNKKILNNKNTKIAMSETPEEEAEMLLGGEALEFLKWLKEHPNQTYNDWLKDKSASVKEDKKQDMNVIDLVPFLPTFEEEIKKLEEEEKNKEESREDFMRRRVREIQLAEADKFGIARLLN